MSQKMQPTERFSDARKIAIDLSAEQDADILFFNGEIQGQHFQKFFDTVCERKRKKSVFFILVTPGGDPHVAFRMSRILQTKYSRFDIFVPGWCKSAGTLIALGGNRLFITDRGEMDPLDIQVQKPGEVLEMGSGLTIDSALQNLKDVSSKMLNEMIFELRRNSGGAITTRVAADVAADLIGRFMESIFRQIDPMKIGEISRAIEITKHYGIRLARTGRNIKSRETLDFLVSGYPDHRFVIDRDEAKILFREVHEPTNLMEKLAVALSDSGIRPSGGLTPDGSPFVAYLSSELADTNRARATRSTKGSANVGANATRRVPLRKPATARAGGTAPQGTRTAPANGKGG